MLSPSPFPWQGFRYPCPLSEPPSEPPSDPDESLSNDGESSQQS